MIIDFLLNALCKKKLEKQRAKLKSKIADIENYRDRAIQRVNRVKEDCNQRLNNVFEYLSNLEINIKNNFYMIVHNELMEISNIVKQSNEIVFDMIDLDWKIKLLTARKNNKRIEINIRKRSKDEANKILKVLLSSYKKDARLKWFNEVNHNNIKCIEDLNNLKTEENAENINMLMDLCERDLINRDNILTIKKYISSEDIILNKLFKDVNAINEEIENMKNESFNCYTRYKELKNKYYDLYNREIDDNEILPDYEKLIERKCRLKIIKEDLYKKAYDFSKVFKTRCINKERIINYTTLKEEEQTLWDNYKKYKLLFDNSV